MEDPKTENLAETLARVLPQAEVLLPAEDDGGVAHVALPNNFTLKEIDPERLMLGPRRAKLKASFSDAASFLAYVAHHKDGEHSRVWCDFDPAAGRLSFVAVLDDLGAGSTRWREHRATYVPRRTHEWITWAENNGAAKTKDQLAFAEFLERNEKDIAAHGGFPSSLEMLKMATAFEATADKRVKSSMRLQSGGLSLEYVDTDDPDTVTRMSAFDKFQIGIPVFWSLPPADGTPVPAYPIQARLKYRNNSGKLSFWYELIRSDRVYEQAAMVVLQAVREGLGDVPLSFGSAE